MPRKDLVNLGSAILIDYNDFGVVAGMPFGIVGAAAAVPAVNWNFTANQKAFALQNLSGDWIEISHDSTAANGFRIANNTALRIDFADTWNGGLYAVNSGGGAVNCIMSILWLD